MKRFICAHMILVLAAAVAFAGSRGQEAAPGGDLEAKARRFVECTADGDYKEATADFDETMLKVFGPEKIEPVWKNLLRQAGAFKKQAGTRREKLGNYDIVFVTCEFEKTALDARVVFDPSGRIAGLQFVPSLPPAAYAPPSYADPSLFEEIPVVVGEGGEWPLPGTLTVPKGSGPYPGLVLVHGSGPNDRDESIGPNKPFKDLAWGLASRGIAVLRYDKRTRVFGQKIVADPKLHASMTVKEETIDDALAAFRLLEKNPRIDPNRIYVLGHSLGGMLVPRIAEAGKDLPIAGFIVMAGLTRTLEDTMVQQISYISSLGGALSEEDKKKIDALKEEAEKIKAISEKDVVSGAKFMGVWAGYWLDLKGYYPPQYALTAVKKPMLILQGSRDYQVTIEDFENWKKALGSKKNVTFKLYPKLNHLFFEGSGLPTPAEYMQIHGSVAPYVIDDIAAFIRP